MSGELGEESGEGVNRPRLFLSYTRADSDYAQRMIAILEGAGFEVWWDGLLEGGVNYLPTTEAALEGADCVVVLWSKLSVDSAWVRDEAQSGRERGRLVPLSIDGTIAPLGFRQIQLIDLSHWNGKADAPEIDKVTTAIRKLCGEAGPVPAPSPAKPATASSGAAVSRRNLMLGGAGLAALATGVGAWQFGLFEPGAAGDAAIGVAVLGFANLTGQEDENWFSSGLSNELRSILARNPRLRVSAPTSSTMTDQGDDFAIGRALGVPYLLRGSVQRAESTLRISAELVEVAGGVVRWGETYDRKIADVFEVQSDIAKTVALSLVAQIASDREAQRSLADQEELGGTNDLAAYEAYLRGSALAGLTAGIETDRAALAQFDAAIASDVSYASAYVGRANQLAAIANATSDASEVADLYQRSIAAANQALEIEPALARAHLALGFARNNHQFDRAGAYPHYQKARELDPGNADIQRSVALFYGYGEEPEEGLRLIEGVLDLDPLNASAFRTASYIAMFARDYAKSIQFAEQALTLNPNIVALGYVMGTAHLMQGNLKGARKSYESDAVPVYRQTGTAIIQKKLGDDAAARTAFDELLADSGDAALYQQAEILAQWGERERAIETLTRAFDQRDPGILFAINDPLLDPLRSAPEFDQLLLRLTS